MSVNVNLNGIDQLDLNFGGTTTASLTAPGVVTITNTPASGGSVTSVGLTVPSRQTVTGSPVTSSGTLAVSDNTQPANEVFAGPSSGSASTPSFRALVPADLPVATTSALGAVQPDGSTITISGGVISGATSGITQLTGDVTAGPGSGSQVVTLSNTSTARSHLGLGTMATQNANAVAVTGGTVDGTAIGATTPSSVVSTTVLAQASGALANEGAALMWNGFGASTGETDFVNYRGTGPGGWRWMNLADNTSPAGATCQMTLDPSGDLSAEATVQGKNLTIQSGGGGALTFQDGTTQTTAATSPTLQTNGTNNTVQNKLNLVAGSNVTLTADGSGDVTVAASGGGGTGSLVGILYSYNSFAHISSVFTYTTAALTGMFRVTINVASISGTAGASVGYSDSTGSYLQALVTTTTGEQGSGSFLFYSVSSAITITAQVSTSGSYCIPALVIEQM